MNDLNGTKVMLINVPLRETALPNNLPLGLALLAARLRQYGVIPTIVDLNVYRIKDDVAQRRGLENGRHLTLGEAGNLLKKCFAEYGDQNLIGLSGLITTLRWQENIAKIIKQFQPDAFLVSGNGLATELKAGLFDWIPELDAVALAEGDDIILEIAHDVKTNQRKRIYQGNPVSDLDKLPLPAYDLLTKDINGFPVLDFYLKNPVWGSEASNSSATPFTMKRSINTVSSRGCPYNCKFCFRGQQGGRNYRARSVQSLIQEAKFYSEEYQVDFIGYEDDNFMIKHERIAELAPLLKPLNIRWGTHGRLDEADERVDLMAEAGCVYIGFGGESACPAVLKNMNKGGLILAKGEIKINGYSFPRTMVEGIKRTKEAGIHGNCTWIMGWPGESLQDLKTTVAFIKWQEDYYPQGSVNKNMFVATAYPGTELFLDPKVRQKLEENFGIKFDRRKTYQPICDKNMHDYVLELDDATKVLCNQEEKPLNFSNMPEDIFLQAKEYIDKGETLKILDI